MIVHSGMVSHHSAVLDKDVNGDMVEAKTGVAVLDDIEVGTFARFCEWGYTGDYKAVEPEILLDSSMIGGGGSQDEAKLDVLIDDALSVFDGFDGPAEIPAVVIDPLPTPSPPPAEALPLVNGSYASIPRGKKIKLTLKQSQWLGFKKLKFDIDLPPIDICPNANTEPCEDYSQVFLCHARLYVFADRYDTEPLRELSKHKLHRSLVAFTLYTERVGDIVALLRYVYANTPDRDHVRDALRELVMQYVVCHYDKMAPSEEFLSLMEEGGACVRDCFSMMLTIVN